MKADRQIFKHISLAHIQKKFYFSSYIKIHRKSKHWNVFIKTTFPKVL